MANRLEIVNFTIDEIGQRNVLTEMTGLCSSCKRFCIVNVFKEQGIVNLARNPVCYGSYTNPWRGDQKIITLQTRITGSNLGRPKREINATNKAFEKFISQRECFIKRWKRVKENKILNE